MDQTSRSLLSLMLFMVAVLVLALFLDYTNRNNIDKHLTKITIIVCIATIIACLFGYVYQVFYSGRLMIRNEREMISNSLNEIEETSKQYGYRSGN